MGCSRTGVESFKFSRDPGGADTGEHFPDGIEPLLGSLIVEIFSIVGGLEEFRDRNQSANGLRSVLAETPSRRAIGRTPSPSALAKITLARRAKPCAALRRDRRDRDHHHRVANVKSKLISVLSMNGTGPIGCGKVIGRLLKRTHPQV